jgi:hypothetical protein
LWPKASLCVKSSLLEQSLPRTQSWPKTSVNPVILSNFSSCSSCPSWLKNLFNQRNPRLINDLCLYNCRDNFTNVMSALQINLFLQNEPNFRKSQMNVSKVLVMDYEQMDTWSIRKNEPKTNPNEPKTNPILADKTPIRTQFKPKRTQFQTLPCKNGSHELKYVDMLAQLALNLKIRKDLN